MNSDQQPLPHPQITSSSLRNSPNNNNRYEKINFISASINDGILKPNDTLTNKNSTSNPSSSLKSPIEPPNEQINETSILNDLLLKCNSLKHKNQELHKYTHESIKNNFKKFTDFQNNYQEQYKNDISNINKQLSSIQVSQEQFKLEFSEINKKLSNNYQFQEQLLSELKNFQENSKSIYPSHRIGSLSQKQLNFLLYELNNRFEPNSNMIQLEKSKKHNERELNSFYDNIDIGKEDDRLVLKKQKVESQKKSAYTVKCRRCNTEGHTVKNCPKDKFYTLEPRIVDKNNYNEYLLSNNRWISEKTAKTKYSVSLYEFHQIKN